MEVSHAWIQLAARALEYGGIAAILLGAALALARYALHALDRGDPWQHRSFVGFHVPNWLAKDWLEQAQAGQRAS